MVRRYLRAVLAGLQEAAQQPICIKRNFIVAYLGVLRLNLAPWKWRAYLFLAREISPCKPKYLRPFALGKAAKKPQVSHIPTVPATSTVRCGVLIDSECH
jgi:hypothetical protein